MVWNEVFCLFVLIVVGTVSAMPADDFSGNAPLSRRERPVRKSGGRPSFREQLPTPFKDDFQESALAKSGSQGFIVGIPSDFPTFQSLGGFEPLGDNVHKQSNFIPEIKIPSVGIPDISEAQPVLTPENFPSRKLLPL